MGAIASEANAKDTSATAGVQRKNIPTLQVQLLQDFTRRTDPSQAVIGSVRMLTLVLALAAAIGQDDLPPGKGKETLENPCTECHGLDRVLARLRTAVQWRDVAT